MISVSKKKWTEKKVFSTNVELAASTYNISYNLAKFYLLRKYNAKELKLEKSNKYDFDFVEKSKDFIDGANFLFKIIKKKEKTLIFGDYDVDGVLSVASFINIFNKINHPYKYILPNRFEDGYGPNIKLIKKSLKNIKNVIFVDCGSNSHDVIDYLNRLNIQTLIIDHHEINNNINPNSTIFINPKKNNRTDNICSTTLSFFLINLLNKKLYNSFRTDEILFFCKIASITDVTPMRGLNRYLNKSIPQEVKYIENKGLKYLIGNVLMKKEISYQDIGYMIGPIINSSGRISKADDALKLVIDSNEKNIEKFFKRLMNFNKTRKNIETYNLSLIDYEKIKNEKIIFIYNKKFHEGLIGIIASRIKDIYNRPTFIFTKSNDKIKCSVRSNDDLSLKEVIEFLFKKKIILSGGGHEMAAGLTLLEKNLDELIHIVKCEFENKIKNKNTFYDIESVLPDNKSNLIDDLEKLQPFGSHNSEPLILFKNLKKIKHKIVSDKHIQCILKNKRGRSINSIAFNCVKNEIGYYLQNLKTSFHIIGCINQNTKGPKRSLQLQIIDLIL